MKRMKRILAGLLVAGMMLALVGCGGGGEEKTVTLRADMTADMGVPATDTMILTAKGDLIQTLKEVMEIDLADIDEDLRDVFIDALEEAIVSVAQGIDGITCSSNLSGSVYTIEVTFDCTKSATVKAASETGLLQIEGDTDKLSLKATQDGLTASGYVVVE